MRVFVPLRYNLLANKVETKSWDFRSKAKTPKYSCRFLSSALSLMDIFSISIYDDNILFGHVLFLLGGQS